MEFRIEQSVLEQYPNLHIINKNDVVTIGLSNDNPYGSMFPLNFPLKNLDNFTWKMIDDIGRAGKARTLFEIGATKKDHMKNGFEAEYQIIGFDHDDLADENGKAPISWDLVSLYQDQIYMKKNSEESCWDSSDGRQFLNNDFFNNMSDELRAIVKPVWKLSADQNGTILKSRDCVWLKSEKELYGRIFYSYDGEGHWYELYRQEDIPWHKFDLDGDRAWQWLRSVNAGDTYHFCIVITDGSANSNHSGHSFGVAPGFCT